MTTSIVEQRDDSREGSRAITPNPGGVDNAPSQAAVRQLAALQKLAELRDETDDLSLLLHDAAVIIARALDAECFAVCETDLESLTPTLSVGQALTDRRQRDTVQFELRDDEATSACLYAINNQTTILLDSTDQETRFDDQQLRELGLLNGVVCPIIARTGENAHAAVAVLDRQARSFQQQDMDFLITVSRYLSLFVDFSNTSRALDDQRQCVSNTFDAMESLVVLTDRQGNILQANAAFRQLSGATDLENRRLQEFVADDDGAALNSAIDAIVERGEPQSLTTSVETLEQGHRNVAWTLSGLTGGGETIVATGIDKTSEGRTTEASDRVDQDDDVPTREVSGNDATLKQQAEPHTKSAFQMNASDVDRARVGASIALDQTESPRDVATDKAGQSPTQGGPRSDRRHPRRPYPTLQLVAPYDDQTIPPLSEFLEVRCRDISAGGFSFFLPKPPEFQKLVVVFGGGSQRIPLVAEVVHVTPVRRQANDQYVVGCQYTGRIKLSG